MVSAKTLTKEEQALNRIADKREESFPFVPFDSHTTTPEEVTKDLETWADHPYSLALPQFLGQKQMPWEWMKIWLTHYPEVRDAWNRAKAVCCQRLFDFSMEMEKLASHKQRIVNKYLDLYDVHAFEIQRAQREAVTKEFVQELPYAIEEWKVAKLHEEFERHYDVNQQKRQESPTDPTVLSPTLTDNYLKHRVLKERGHEE